MKDVTTIVLRILILLLSILSLYIWIEKYRIEKNINFKTIAFLMCTTSLGFFFFVVVTMLNHNLYEIEPWILNIASNTVRIQAVTSILVSGVLSRSDGKLLKTLADKIEKIILSKSE